MKNTNQTRRKGNLPSGEPLLQKIKPMHYFEGRLLCKVTPRVLILDEPTAGLDRDTTERIVIILNGLNLPSIIASHDLDFLARVTDETRVLRDGYLVPAAEHTLHAHYHVHRAGGHPHYHSHLDED